jgi:DNA-binding NarL/FixJ family response regulator
MTDNLGLVLRRTKDQRIVIVEDEVFIREALESYFGDQNEVLCYASAEEALAAQDQLGGATVFIMDYKLSGMNGIELFQQLRLRFAKARYILITGEMTYEMAENTRRLGLDALMLKPFDFTILENNISSLVAAS